MYETCSSIIQRYPRCGQPTARPYVKNHKDISSILGVLSYLIQSMRFPFGIDAPLSLPGVYKGLLGTKNYHYRECDQQVGAMSPLFLGGLTARAMELKSWAEQSLSSTVIEVYPKLMAQKIALDPKLYKKSREYLSEAFEHLSKDHSLGINTNNSIDNWHQFDALLALATSLRFATGIAEEIGRKDEGIIYF